MQIIDLKTAEKRILKLNQPGEYQINLLVPGAEVIVSGAFVVKGSQKLFCSVTICHLAPHTSSTATLKAVGKDKSFTKLMGRIIIAPDCFASRAFLTERVLLLSKQARAQTIPDLEIKNHDVKCSHAASIGQINQEELFYLMSRGISQKEAEAMIISGFLQGT